MPKISALIFFLLLLQSCDAQKTTSDQEEKISFESLIIALILEKQIPSIAVGIVKDGKTVMAKGYG